MKRRTFLQTSLSGVALSALPVPMMAVTPASPPSLSAGGAAKAFWKSYFSTTPGQSALQSVQMSMGVGPAQAQQVVRRFVARGHLSPGAMMGQIAHANSTLGENATPRENLFDVKDLTEDEVPQDLRDLRADITCDCEDMA